MRTYCLSWIREGNLTYLSRKIADPDPYYFGKLDPDPH
jgi:hypothetical protein